MISALDTSVILDILRDDPRFGPSSLATIRRASLEGSLIVAPSVWAEVCAAFTDAEQANATLDRIGVNLVGDDRAIATAAGVAWRAYRQAGGTRRRVLPDFLIAAHALLKADRLVTRDRGFYRTYFDGLRIVDPSA